MAVAIWAAHEDPDRPLAFGAVFCGCAVCSTVLGTAALCEPELQIGIKFGMGDRVIVEAGVLAADGMTEPDLLRRFADRASDWIRDVWVARADDALSPLEAAFFKLMHDAEMPARSRAPSA